jgi:hypothetical protein
MNQMRKTYLILLVSTTDWRFEGGGMKQVEVEVEGKGSRLKAEG